MAPMCVTTPEAAGISTRLPGRRIWPTWVVARSGMAGSTVAATVEGRLRDGVPWSEWDTRGQREWLANAVEQGWAQPDGAPDSAESRGALRKQTKGAPTRPGGVVSEASSVPALLRQGDVLLIPVAGISDLGVVDPSGAVAAESALGRARAPHVPRRRERGGDPGS